MQVVRSHLVRLAALAAGLVLVQGAALAADAGKGKQSFMKYGCWQCHGTVGSIPKSPDPNSIDILKN